MPLLQHLHSNKFSLRTSTQVCQCSMRECNLRTPTSLDPTVPDTTHLCPLLDPSLQVSLCGLRMALHSLSLKPSRGSSSQWPLPCVIAGGRMTHPFSSFSSSCVQHARLLFIVVVHPQLLAVPRRRADIRVLDRFGRQIGLNSLDRLKGALRVNRLPSVIAGGHNLV